MKLLSEQRLSLAEAARNLGIHPNLLRNWKQRIEAEGEDGSLAEDERVELARSAARTRRKHKVTTDSGHSHPVADNVLNREFQQDAPDRVWLADITFPDSFTATSKTLIAYVSEMFECPHKDSNLEPID